MIDGSARKVRGLREKIADEVRFFRSWAENPLTTGAVSPSSADLAKRMASFVEADGNGKVLELGPGTGVVTKEILRHGVPARDIVALEYNGEFCRLLKRRHPDMAVVEGDAYTLRKTLGEMKPGSLSSIVSSLPLFTRPRQVRRALIDDALTLLKPGAPFIQFSYALFPPVTPEAGWCTLQRTGWIVMNLPPARVWIYRRPEIRH
ncbi:methyltransferase domain-containing protein [Rhizobiales bacterium]|uniref:class I SAM-dependent methyltransferase n=1 Tax=Hongsoonwoonella zoysiae TaxID=2821844 RepID=UPI001560C261|nr:methyltransferase domain-containing protein [Hongsoonwoonella zoysiae]NRG16518.1 methyltransferase domain-containing protein [Hongsoonwoonella zoysiae]